MSGDSGWITTEVAARAVRVGPRTIRRYISRGELEAKPQGEGVRREWLVSVDSLHALRATRTTGEYVPEADRGMEYADSIADVVRDMAARLESRAEEAAELRVRLELTERAQSTLEDERRQALQDLEEERQRREAAEQEREALRRELEVLQEARESPESPGPTETSPRPLQPLRRPQRLHRGLGGGGCSGGRGSVSGGNGQTGGGDQRSESSTSEKAQNATLVNKGHKKGLEHFGSSPIRLA